MNIRAFDDERKRKGERGKKWNKVGCHGLSWGIVGGHKTMREGI